MRDFISTACFVLALGLLEAALGPRATRLRVLLAALLLVPLAIDLALAARRRVGAAQGWRTPAAILASGLLLILAFGLTGAAQFFAIAAAWMCLASVQAPAGSSAVIAWTAALTAFGYGVFALLRDHLTLWPFLVQVSTSASAALANLWGVERRLGPTYSGLWLLVLCGLTGLARVAVTNRMQPRRTAVACGLLLLAPLAWFALGRIPSPHSHTFSLGVALGWRIVLFALLLVPLGLFLAAHPATDSNRAPTVRRARFPSALATRRARWIGAVLVAVGGLTLGWTSQLPSRPVRLLIDTRGAFSLQPLEWGRYGPNAPQGASIANLPAIVRAYGWTCTLRDSALDAAALAATDVLLVMNPKEVYATSEHEAIWQWVRAGGGLLVLGDHTDIQGVMEPLNRLLEPSGIEVAFDSAIPVAERWTWYSCMRFHPHPITLGLRDESEVKISVGASLRLPPSALPLVTGRDGYADAGDTTNALGAYLGNMRYDRKEQLGDLPLAAAQTVGRGRVVVFGDTSPFQRSAVSFTHGFVARVFTYLAGDKAGVPPRAVRWAGGVVMLAGTLFLALGPAAGLPLLGVAAALLAAFELQRTKQPPAPSFQAEVAYVDLAHGNRVDVHAGRENGIAGLLDHLWRQEFLPIAMRKWDAEALAHARLFVTVAPAFEFASGERQALRHFVESGGTLIIATGFEERRGAQALLAEFGYAIGRTPIGAAHMAVTRLEGQHAIMHEAWPVERPAGRGEVWVESWDYPLIVFERLGEGSLIVIGDSRFLCDVKLESPEQFVEPNIDFLRRALEVAEPRSAGAAR